MKLSEYNKV